MKRNAAQFAALAAIALVSCGRSSGPRSSFAPVGPLGIVATLPATGTANVEPDTTVTLTFAAAQDEVSVQDVVFDDGGAHLPGTFVATSPSSVWRWQPTQQLPRGATIEVRVPVGAILQTVASFTVREANGTDITTIPGTFASNVRAWRSGRRVVMSGGSTFEISDGDEQPTVTQLNVVVPTSAWIYGDNKFAFTEPQGVLLPEEFVRRDLDGNEERIALPFRAPVVAHNETGDAVLFVAQGTVGTANDWGIWRLRANESQWQWLGPLARMTAPDLGIDAEGNVAAVYKEGLELVIEHFLVGNLVPVRYSMLTPKDWIEGQFDLAEDGTGIYSWRDSQFNIARFLPGTAELETTALPLPTPNVGVLINLTTTNALEGVQAINGGSAVLYSRYSQSSFETFLQGSVMQRIKADDSVQRFEQTRGFALFGATERASQSSGQRGEVWSLVRPTNGDSMLEVERSRPGKTFEPLLSIADYAPAGTQIQSIVWAIDDSGRAILAINEVGSPDCRVILIH
ncbi:MAG: hypothetical protein ACI89X_005030 [Planctomycetota bacterium]|jgi:hypothetical protein